MIEYFFCHSEFEESAEPTGVKNLLKKKMLPVVSMTKKHFISFLLIC